MAYLFWRIAEAGIRISELEIKLFGGATLMGAYCFQGAGKSMGGQNIRKDRSIIDHHDLSIAASDPYVASQKIRQEVPDVITLDVEMPRMDGITFLQKIMSQHPIPVVMCSSLTEKGAETTLKALEYGAVEIIEKPRLGTKKFLEESRTRICDVVKAAASSKTKRIAPVVAVQPKLTADAVLAKPVKSKAMIRTTEKVVVEGASTGGTEAL